MDAAEDVKDSQDEFLVQPELPVDMDSLLPHMREYCPIHQMVVEPTKYCQKCFCFVCDKLASQCTVWHLHCHAKDKTPKWLKERKSCKRQRGSTSSFIVVDEPLEEERKLLSNREVLSAIRYTSRQPRLTSAPTPSLPRLGQCDCARLCLPVQHLILDPDRPFLILTDLNKQEIAVHLRWVLAEFGHMLCAKSLLGSPMYVIAKKVFRGVEQVAPWEAASPDYQGVKVGRFRCKHRQCRWWSKVDSKGDSCLQCRGSLSIQSITYQDGGQECENVCDASSSVISEGLDPSEVLCEELRKNPPEPWHGNQEKHIQKAKSRGSSKPSKSKKSRTQAKASHGSTAADSIDITDSSMAMHHSGAASAIH